MEINERLNQIATIAYSTKQTVFNTYNLAKEMMMVDGCFVECGIGAGAQIMAMQLASNGLKSIYAFDSFEGIPMAGKHDKTQPGIGKIKHNKNAPLEERLISSGITSHSHINVLDNFDIFQIPLESIFFIKGWFQNTMSLFDTGPISLLRLDGDLYESTLVCLEHLYPKVCNGGIVIIDDYALEGCKKAVRDYFKNSIPKMIIVEGGEGVAYFYKKTKSIEG